MKRIARPIRLLALDLGSKVGVCRWWQDGDAVETESWNLAEAVGGDPVRQLDHFSRRLTVAVDAFGPTLLALARARGGHMTAKLEGQTELIALRRDVILYPVTAGQVLDAVALPSARRTSNGHPTMAGLVLALSERFPDQAGTPAAARAMGVWLTARADLTGEALPTERKADPDQAGAADSARSTETRPPLTKLPPRELAVRGRVAGPT